MGARYPYYLLADSPAGQQKEAEITRTLSSEAPTYGNIRQGFSRIESITDESDLEEIYNTERHLLYVACTRARDDLWVSGVEPSSEFLDDLL